MRGMISCVSGASRPFVTTQRLCSFMEKHFGAGVEYYAKSGDPMMCCDLSLLRERLANLLLPDPSVTEPSVEEIAQQSAGGSSERSHLLSEPSPDQTEEAVTYH